MFTSKSFRGFSLIEVLVILGILSIVVAMVLPSFRLSNEKVDISITSSRLYSIFNVLQLQSVNSDSMIIVSFNYNTATNQLDSLNYNTVTNEAPNTTLSYVDEIDIPAGVVLSSNMTLTHIVFNPNRSFSYYYFNNKIATENLNLTFVADQHESSIIFYYHSGKIVLYE